MLEHKKRQVLKWKFYNMRCLAMFIAAVCLLFQNPVSVQPPLLTFMFPIDLLNGEIFVRLCVWVTNPHVEKGRALPIPWTSNRASGAWFVSLVSTSPVISRRTGSTCTSWQTMFSMSTSRSRSSLCLWMMNPPRLHTMVWSTVNVSPQTQVEGVSAMCQSKRRWTASLNSL